MEKKQIVNIISDRTMRSPGIEFEIFVSDEKVLSIEIKEGQVENFRSSRELGLALRVLRDGRLGFTYLFGPTPDGVAQLADRAVELAGQGDYDPLYSFPAEASLEMSDLGTFDARLSSIGKKEKIEYVKEMENSALNLDPRIKRVRKAEYEETTCCSSIVNSQGLDLEKQETRVDMSLMAIAEEDSRSETGWESDSARIYAHMDPIQIGVNAARRGIAMLGSRPITTCTCPAVLENRVVADLVDVWSSSFLGENICKGKSYLKDKINRTIASPKINLIDDGTYPGGLGSAPFDDEGTPQGKTPLVKEGRLMSYLFDCYWAKKTGSEYTGNAIRAHVASPPCTSVSNLFICTGTLSFDQLVATMESGFLIKELLGVHLIDPVSGEFSLGASGVWIEKGESIFPVQGVTVSGSIHDLFSAVEETGHDLRFFGRIGAPSLLVEKIIVSGP